MEEILVLGSTVRIEVLSMMEIQWMD